MKKIGLMVIVFGFVLSVVVSAISDEQQIQQQRNRYVQEQQARINYINQLQQQKQRIDIEIQAQQNETFKLQGKIDLLDEQAEDIKEKDSIDTKVEEKKK